ncbi:MAG: Wzz/FepE/Etk N-terminal domain-containing protein [Gaiellaceae bacterium]
MSELEPEVEIDLGRLGRSLLRGWWLIAAAIVIGAVIGVLVASSGGELFQARSSIYLGQPLSTSGTAQLQTLQTNPSSIGQIVKGQDLVRSVADEVGLGASALRRNISTRTVSGFVTRSGQTPLVEVIVRGKDRAKVTQAANLLAQAVVGDVSNYAVAKIAALEATLVDQDRQVVNLDRDLERLDAVIDDASVPAAERALFAIASQTANQRRGILTDNRAKTQLDLTVAQEVELGRVVNEASATKVDARSRRSSVVVGAIVGGIVGIGLALLAPFARSRIGRRMAG